MMNGSSLGSGPRSWFFLAIAIVSACGGGTSSGTGSTGESTAGSATAGDGAESPTSVTTPTTDDDTGTCPIGAELCPCTAGNACDSGLECSDGTCVSVDCTVGAQNCPCTQGGACDADLSCEDGFCVDAGSSSVGSDGTTDATTSTTNATTDGTDTGEPVDLEPWTRRRPIHIDNPNADDLVDHQVRIAIDWDDDMSFDLADLRFTDEAGETLHPHWIESFTAPVTLAAWVRVPMVPANDTTTIYVWYGNPDAPSVDDPESTFHFWDDFEGNDLDAAVWSASDLYSVANGRLSLSTGAVYTNIPAVTLPGFMLEVDVRWPQGGGAPGDASSGVTLASAQGNVGQVDYIDMAFSGPVAKQALYGGQQIAYQLDPTHPHPAVTFEYIGVGAGADAVRFSYTHFTEPGYASTFGGVTREGDFYIRLGGSGGSVIGTTPIYDVEYENVLVRRFALLAPDPFVAGEEDV